MARAQQQDITLQELIADLPKNWLFSEILWFEELAADCREDGQWSFLYAAAPVHVVGATGAPVNPVVVK